MAKSGPNLGTKKGTQNGTQIGTQNRTKNAKKCEKSAKKSDPTKASLEQKARHLCLEKVGLQILSCVQ